MFGVTIVFFPSVAEYSEYVQKSKGADIHTNINSADVKIAPIITNAPIITAPIITSALISSINMLATNT